MKGDQSEFWPNYCHVYTYTSGPRRRLLSDRNTENIMGTGQHGHIYSGKFESTVNTVTLEVFKDSFLGISFHFSITVIEQGNATT